MKTIDAVQLRKLFLDGANNLNNNKEYINELNVFPVPDGDTGTNMTLTIMAAASDIKTQKDPTIDSLAKAISTGSLRGARGNSGVILSQLFRGFCKDIKGKKELSLADISAGFERAVETAYKAVMKPKEGTILTVARGISERASELVQEDEERDVLEFAEELLATGEVVLEHTPELLPVLAEAGVVDSGGQGLIEMLRGIVIGLKGGTVEASGTEQPRLARGAGLLDDMPKARPSYAVGSGNDNISTADIKFTYCTEFIILLDKELTDEQVEELKKYMLSIGDSLVCVADEELVKIHIHTNHPGNAFEKALTYGQLTRMKVDNMREEHSERVLMEQERHSQEDQEKIFKQIKMERKATVSPVPAGPRKSFGFVAVAAGAGIAKILQEIGVDYVLSGGQTMNPSTDDILQAVNQVNADTVYVLPNNKNIILAAKQAAGICKDKEIIVIPSRSVPQGISAMIAFSDQAEKEQNRQEMTAALDAVKTGEVTFSVRDTSLEGKTILKGDIMGIDDTGIVAVGSEAAAVTEKMISCMMDDNAGLITVYYGEDTKEEEADQLAERLREAWPDVDVDLHFGGQPIYYYLVSVE
ncbi:MAG: DAK2 domain-containing protein [Eubacterium sp.]|nr:DAK2 domain-containing protein [Eubacterium sp.]